MNREKYLALLEEVESNAKERAYDEGCADGSSCGDYHFKRGVTYVMELLRKRVNEVVNT